MKRFLLLALILLLLAGQLSAACAKTEKAALPDDGGTLAYEIEDGGCAIKGWSGSAEQLKIPEAIDGVPVTAIKAMAFRGKGMREVIIPDSVTRIGKMAFQGCASLERATLPQGLEAIPDILFQGCTSLKEVSIPPQVTEIGEMVFAGCTQLSALEMPETLTTIDDMAFHSCVSLREIRLPDGLTHLGRLCFYGCKDLTALALPEGLTELGWGAFNMCTGIREMTLPDSLADVGYNPFAYMQLERLNVSPDHPCLQYEDGVLYSKADHRLIGCAEPGRLPTRYAVKAGTEIVDECAFALCRGLESISFPDSVHTINALAFAGCDGLTDIRWSAGLKQIGSWAFKKCDALTEIALPEGFEWLPTSAIDNCANLERVVIPASVTRLRSNSITDCPKAVLVVTKGSPAERILRDEKIKYVYPDGSVPTVWTRLEEITEKPGISWTLILLGAVLLLVLLRFLFVRHSER